MAIPGETNAYKYLSQFDLRSTLSLMPCALRLKLI